MIINVFEFLDVSWVSDGLDGRQSCCDKLLNALAVEFNLDGQPTSSGCGSAVVKLSRQNCYHVGTEGATSIA